LFTVYVPTAEVFRGEEGMKMGALGSNCFKLRLMQSTALIGFLVLANSAQAQTQTVATPLNANAINLLMPFSTLVGTPTIAQNLTTAISINNNSTASQRAQALIDNTITTDNAVVLSDGLGTRMNSIWRSVNSQTSSGATTTFSPNVLQLFRQINAISQDDSGKAKNYFADGSANGTQFTSAGIPNRTATSNTPIVGLSLPAGGVFNVYDRAYAPVALPNLTGDSRPVQVAPNSIAAFSGVDYFGSPQSNTNIINGGGTATSFGLRANASFPSGHTTFGFTSSLLMAMLVPERYQEVMTRGSEYGDSRVVLGVHYPLDVIAGRVLASYDVAQMLNNNASYLGATVNGVFGIGDLTTTSNFQTLFTAAQADVRNLLQTGCGTTDLAACAASGAPDRFSNLAQDRAAYMARLTYGLPTLSYAQAPREAAPAGGPDASILLATVYGGSSAAAKQIAPTGGLFGSLQTSTINQIIVNTEINALAAFYGTPLSYWSRLDLVSAYGYFQNVTGTISLDAADRVTTNVTVADTGILAGAGTVATTTVLSGGALQPGSGTAGSSLRISGNLAMQSGALYLVQASATGTPFTSVTGTATLAGRVQVSSPTGSYRFSAPSTILTASSLNGTRFDALSTPTGITGSLSYSGNAVALNLQSSLGQLAGLNANQRSIGAGLDAAFNGAGGSTGALGPIFTGNVAQNLQQVATSQAVTGVQQTSFDAMTQFVGTMLDGSRDGRGIPAGPGAGVASFAEQGEATAYAATGRKRSGAERGAYAMITKAPPRAVYDPRWNVWAAGFGGSQSTDGDAGAGSNDTTSRVYGVAVGADYWFSPDTVAGFALAGGGTRFSVDAAGSGRSDLFQAGAFVRHNAGPAYLSAAAAYGWQDVTANRTVAIVGLDQLQSQFNANSFTGRVEGGYRIVSPELWFGVTPYAAAQVTALDLPAYSETAIAGANAFALNYQAKTVTDTRSELGLRGDRSFALQGAILTLRSRAAWAHDFNTDRAIGATFQAPPLASFVVNGASQPHDLALATAAAELKWRSGFSLAATFEGEFSDRSRSYAGKGVARYSW